MDIKTLQVKAKSDPEALLNDLSFSLKTFKSTVRTWTTDPKNGNSSSQIALETTNSFSEMRPARLGLGAKVERKSVGVDGVAGNLDLRKQLTGIGKQSIEPHSSQSAQLKFKSFNKQSQSQSFNKQSQSQSFNKLPKSINPSQSQKRVKFNQVDDDEEEGGRASMIKKKK